MTKTGRCHGRLAGRCLATAAMMLCLAGSSLGAGLIDQALNDLQVLYLFDDPQTIDWPTLYYINESFACEVDLLAIAPDQGFSYSVKDVPGKAIALYQYNVALDDPAMLDSVLAVQFRKRRPDVVIIGEVGPGSSMGRLAAKIQNLADRPGSIYSVRKIYRDLSDQPSPAPSGRLVTISRSEMYSRYKDRMEIEIPQLYRWLQVEPSSETFLKRYELVSSKGLKGDAGPDFLTGIEPLRLLPLLDSVLAEGAAKQSFVSKARLFVTFFDGARRTVGAKRVENAMAGHKALLTLLEQIQTEPTLSGIPELAPYLEERAAAAQEAVLNEIGMSWDGKIILRDSPQGPRLKFRASVTVDGPQTIELTDISFHPYWDTTAVSLDGTPRKITPHQSFVREYLVDIDRSRLEATMPESLLFVAQIVYSSVPMTVRSAVPIWEKPDLQVEFHPDFFFVPPVARIEVDRVVSAMNWKAVITKPRYYHGTVTLNLETPRGLFAGAYKQSWELDKGRTSETVRIPFSISNLFELGIQQQTISLSVDGKVVAADTGMIRVAACELKDKVTIGLMPDSTGMLEDILRMASANYRPLTDRTLQTGDLDAYSVILIGSGAIRDYPSFRTITGRLEDYLRNGGTLVLLGQPTDWPEGVLPVSFVPSMERVASTEILNRMPQAKLLTSAYAISESNLLAWLQMRREVAAAVVSPSEAVLVTPSGATLLSVSRLGDGQLIYCGLPLVEMISQLNIEAIHLLANILNY